MSSNNVEIVINSRSSPRINIRFLRSIADFSLNFLGKENCEVSIVCDNDSVIRQLNNKYRNIDQPTDVLSFPSGEINPETGKTYLGDVIISTSFIKKQALELNINFEQELANVVIHGILHLLGYDHAKKIDERKMSTIQNNILFRFSIKNGTKNILETFRHAFRGFVSAYETEKNIKIHMIFGFLAVFVGLWLQISAIEWGLLVVTIAAVFTTEFMNTAMEYVVNLAAPHFDETAKKAKDISAAAVMISVISSVLVGVVIFLPKLWTKLILMFR